MNRIQYLACVLLLLTGCAQENATTTPIPTPASGKFTLQSSGVTNGILAAKYTCDGLSYAPPLTWSNAPANTKSYAITMHTIPPTGDKHVYYVVYNLPASTTALPENNTTIGTFGINTVNGKNSYTPPCSQGPGPKEYVMTAYALSADPVITVAPSKVTMDILLSAISSLTLATDSPVGNLLKAIKNSFGYG